MRSQKESLNRLSELESGLDQATERIDIVVCGIVGVGLRQSGHSGSDSDVVGDLELVEEFPGIARGVFCVCVSIS